MSKSLRVFINLGLLVILLVLYYGFTSHAQLILGAILVQVLNVIAVITEYILTNIKRLKFIFFSNWLALKREKIRFSMSYQFRIKVEDKYLLVANSNYSSFQHVGGKYKCTPGAQRLVKELGADEDLKMQTSGKNSNDIAFFIPAKNAVEFLDWFDSKKNREITHSREFYEELLKTNDDHGSILSLDKFPYIDYEYITTVRTPIKKTPEITGWNCYEYLQYDVLELVPNDSQLEELKILKGKGDTDKVKWASRNLIINHGFDQNEKAQPYRIGEHTKWVIEEKYS